MPCRRTQQTALVHGSALMFLDVLADDSGPVRLIDLGSSGTAVLFSQRVRLGERIRLDTFGRVGRCSPAGS